MNYRLVTKEMLEKAADFVPTLQKMEFVEYASTKCIDTIIVTLDDTTKEMPPFYRINILRRNRYLMGAFIKLYLKENVETIKNDKWLIDQQEFDKWAGGHVFNQIDRLKKEGGNIRNKAFDLLEDYANLKRYFCNEIDALLSCMNDPATRLLRGMQVQVTPDTIKKAVADLKTQVEKIKTIPENKKK